MPNYYALRKGMIDSTREEGRHSYQGALIIFTTSMLLAVALYSLLIYPLLIFLSTHISPTQLIFVLTNKPLTQIISYKALSLGFWTE